MSGRAYPNIRVLRDIQRREAVQATELQRRAYLYLARNTALPTRVSLMHPFVKSELTAMSSTLFLHRSSRYHPRRSAIKPN